MIRPFKNALLLGASIPMLSASPANAQDVGQQAAEAQSPAADIVVTGTRASTQKAIAVKREATQIVDSVSASEIGQLPDFNAGDALRRVTGVSTLLYQGEPRFLVIRGFSQGYNDVLVDGFGLASTDVNMGQSVTNGRQISMEVLPANIASHIDIIKSARPEDEGNFIGGLANFVTPSAFDFKKPTLSVAIKGGQTLDSAGDGSNHFVGEAQISGATRFGSDHQFGLYVSGTYWRRQINVPQEEAGGTQNWYTAAGVATTPYGGNGYPVPSQRLYYNYQNKRQRAGLQGRLDWQGNNGLSAFLSGYYFNQSEDSFRNTLNAAVQSSSTDTNQTATSGTLNNVTQTPMLGRYLWRRHVYGVYGRGKAELGHDWLADFGASWSHGYVNNPQTADSFAQTKLAYNYNTSGFAPLFTPVNPTLANNLALYPATSRVQELYTLSTNRYVVQANIGHNAGAQDIGFGVKAGAAFEETKEAYGYNGTTYTGMTYTLASVTNGSICGFQCDTPIPVISPSAVDAAFAGSTHVTATPNTASDAGGTYQLKEDIWSGYLQGQWRSDKVFIQGGARVEATRFYSASTEAINGVYQPVSAGVSYVDVLPSLNAIYNTSANSKLRFAASMSVGRPPFGAEALHGGTLNTTSATPTLATGNPDLKPRRAFNLDLGHEWYFDGGKGMFAIDGFYKWIRNELYNYGTYQNIAGVSEPVLVTEYQNAKALTRAYGLEASFAHDLDFIAPELAGFGVSANITLSRAHLPLTLSDGSVRVMNHLAEQPGRIVNASLYYDKGRIHGRVAWNYLGKLWDDRFPNFTPAGFYANRFQQPTNNVDLQVSYDVTSRFSISFDAQNLTAQGMSYRYGNNQEILQSTWKLPTQILLGAKVKL